MIHFQYSNLSCNTLEISLTRERDIYDTNLNVTIIFDGIKSFFRISELSPQSGIGLKKLYVSKPRKVKELDLIFTNTVDLHISDFLVEKLY